MRFGVRVILLLFVGVLFALIPHADVDQQLSATEAAVVESATADVSAAQGALSAANSLDFDSLLSNITASDSSVAPPEPSTTSSAPVAPPVSAEPATTSTEAPAVETEPVLTEVLGVSLVDDAPAELAVTPTAPTIIDQPTTTVPPAPAVEPTTAAPTTAAPTTAGPTTAAPTTAAPTTVPPTTVPPTTVPPTTVPPTTVPPTTAAPSIADQMLVLVDFDWRRAFPDWTVEFYGERSGIRGLTYPAEKRVEIFIRSDDTPASLLRIFTHELGHVIDVELNSNEDRRRWVEQRGLASDVPWWPGSEAPDFATGAGDFAETFAVLQTGISTRSTVAGQPTADDLALMRELLLG